MIHGFKGACSRNFFRSGRLLPRPPNSPDTLDLTQRKPLPDQMASVALELCLRSPSIRPISRRYFPCVVKVNTTHNLRTGATTTDPDKGNSYSSGRRYGAHGYFPARQINSPSTTPLNSVSSLQCLLPSVRLAKPTGLKYTQVPQ